MKNITPSVILLFLLSSLLLLSCGGGDDSNTKNIKFTIFTQQVDKYPKLNEELIELILPFQNEETKDKFFPQTFIERIDMPDNEQETNKQEIKGDVSTGGLKAKMPNLQKKYKDAYEKFDLSKGFGEPPNSKGFTKQDYLKKLQGGSDTTIVFLFGKNKSWEFLRDTTVSTIAVVEIIDIEMFRKKIAEFSTKQPQANFVIAYNVNFVVEEVLDSPTAIGVIDKANEMLVNIAEKEKAIKTADSIKQAAAKAIDNIGRTVANPPKSVTPDELSKLKEQAKTLRALLKQKNDEIKSLTTEITQLKTELRQLQVELTTEKEEHKKTKGKLTEKEGEVSILEDQKIKLADAKKEAEDENIKTQIRSFLDKGSEGTKFVKIEGDKVTLYKTDKKGKMVEATNLFGGSVNASTFNEQRIIYKKALKNYKDAYILSKQNGDIMLKEILEDAEKKRQTYYLLLKKSKENDTNYDRVEDFLNAL